ncbi:MAG: YCF48-related protein [Ignavibacteriae bacterium]|nr:YCF48-related protein [Ignavibacteriota bacterium]
MTIIQIFTKKLKEINLTDRILTAIFYLSIAIFFIGFNFQDSRTGGWYQQFLPASIGSAPIADITFVDSLIGYAVTNQVGNNDTNYVLKTTDGGDNWFIIRYSLEQYNTFSRIIFLNKDTGFVAGFNGPSLNISIIDKTTNGGQNWIPLNYPSAVVPSDLFALNIDTIWFCSPSAGFGGLFRTTNGGLNWTVQYNVGGSNNPERIYMYNARIGFMCTFNGFYKTTNCGENWVQVSGESRFTDINFTDSLTGYKANSYIKKTTNGGLNWVQQILPPTNLYSLIDKLSQINTDTLWGIGGSIQFIPAPGGSRGIIYKTTNGGTNWGYQLPDTSIRIPKYSFCKFTNKLNGWSYHFNNGVNTIQGGSDTTFFTAINNNSVIITKVKIDVYDITGKFIKTLINQRKSPGKYEVKFDGSNLASGIYFYSLFVDGNRIDTKKMTLLK